MHSTRRSNICLSAIIFLSVSCGGSSVPKVPLSMAPTDSNPKAIEAAHSLLGPEAKLALDSGNALYRRKAFAPALLEYRLAADRAPQHSAPLFGIYMVARATNNDALADSAMAAIRARNGPLAPTGAGAPHPMTDSSLKALHAKMKKGSKVS
jgi:hypothetical protein